MGLFSNKKDDKVCGYMDVKGNFFTRKEDRDYQNKQYKKDYLKRRLVETLETAVSRENVLRVHSGHTPYRVESTKDFIDTLIKGGQLDDFFSYYKDYLIALRQLDEKE